MSGKCGMKGGRGRSQHRQRQQKRGRQQRGGVGNAPSTSYSDGASYVKSLYGDGDQQWNGVFVKGSQWGNQIVSLDGSQPSSPLSFYNNTQKGGRARGRSQRRQRQQQQGRSQRRQRGQTRSKKGGFFGSVLQEALVPFGLFAAQNTYGKRTRKNRK